jgi:hypothetical protein
MGILVVKYAADGAQEEAEEAPRKNQKMIRGETGDDGDDDDDDDNGNDDDSSSSSTDDNYLSELEEEVSLEE